MTTQRRERKMQTETTRKNRSYTARRALQQMLGKAEGHDFTTATEVRFDDGTTATLLSTSNAGFRGIEGWFDVDGEKRHYSLGRVTEYLDPVTNTWERV